MYSALLERQDIGSPLKLVFLGSDRSRIAISIDTSESVAVSGGTYKFHNFHIRIFKPKDAEGHYVSIQELQDPTFTMTLRLNPNENEKLRMLLSEITNRVSQNNGDLAGGNKKKRKSKKTNRKSCKY